MGEGEGGMIWEDSIETCILPYVKQIISHQSKFDAWNRALKAGALRQPRGMGGEESGRGVQNEETRVPVANSCKCMAKTTTIL